MNISIADRAANLWKDLFDMGVIRDDVDYMEAGVGEMEKHLKEAIQDFCPHNSLIGEYGGFKVKKCLDCGREW